MWELSKQLGPWQSTQRLSKDTMRPLMYVTIAAALELNARGTRLTCCTAEQ